MDNTTELWIKKYIVGEFFSSGGATLYKKPSDQTVSSNVIRFFTEVWTGWSDESSENHWISVKNSSKALSMQSFQPWSEDEPNGEALENCAELYTLSKTWKDTMIMNK